MPLVIVVFGRGNGYEFEEELPPETSRDESLTVFKSRLKDLVLKYGISAKIQLRHVADDPDNHPLGGFILETLDQYVPDRDGRWYGGPMH